MFEDGCIINGNDFLEFFKKGRVVVFFGDMRVSDKLKEFVRDCDVFVYEVIFVKGDWKFVYDYFYSMME